MIQKFPVRIWLISFLGWMFDFYDLVLFSFLLIPIGHELHLSTAQEGVLLGVALGASGVGGILFGYLSDRYGRKQIMTWTIVLYSLGTALTAFSTGPKSLLLFRFITGLGVGGEWAVGHALMAESSPHHMRGRAAAFLQAGEPVGVALAAVTGLLLAPIVGWRTVFLASSLSALVAFLVRRHLPESALWAGAERMGGGGKKEAKLTAWASVSYLINKGYLPVMGKSFLLGVFKLGTYWTCYIWLPKFLQNEFHQPVARSALWILTAQLGQLLGMMGFGFFSDRYGRRVAFSAYSLVTAGALSVLVFFWQDLIGHPVVFWSTMFMLGLGSGCTAGFGALLAELFPTSVRNFAMGTTYNCARGVQFFAPVVVGGFVSVYGLTGGLGVPLVLALLTAVWVWVLPETRERVLAEIGKS